MEILYIMMLALALLSAFYLGMTIKGPSLWDRLLGITLISVKALAMIIIAGTLTDAIILLDFAMIFLLTGFVGTLFTSVFIARSEKFEKKLIKKVLKKVPKEGETNVT